MCFVLLVPPIRDRLLDRAQVSAAGWDARWTERVERGEGLLAEGRYEDAADYLERLDGVFPARHVKHRRDTERERVLRALGEANLALGRKRASLEALRRVVEFDERNYQNHFALASAALELGEPEEALAAFERVLAIHPSHLPTVAALIAHHFERADYRSVADTYEAYLDAYLLHDAGIEVGDGIGRADVRVDGRYHEIDVPLVTEAAAPASGRSLSIDVGPYPTRIANITLMPPLRAGILEAAPITLDSPGGWSNGTEAEKASGTLRVPVGSSEIEVARARIVLRLLKPVDAESWGLIATSYRNLLEGDALEVARERSAIIAVASPGTDGDSS